MCRLAAYLGPAQTLESLLVDPPHGLYRQSYAPEQQVSGTVNADGFGVGWYDPARRPEPAVHKSARSIWADRSFLSFAGLVNAPAMLAVVRRFRFVRSPVARSRWPRPVRNCPIWKFFIPNVWPRVY